MKKFKSAQNIIVRAKSRTTLAIISGLATLAAFAPLASFAVETIGGIESVTIPKTVDLQDLVTKGMNLAFGILLLLAGIFVFAAAFYYLMSATNEENRKKAKSFIIAAVVAIFIAAVSQGVIFIVREFIGGTLAP